MRISNILRSAAMVTVSGSALLAAAAPAFAQDAEGASSGEIVVTAQKRSESLQSVPVAVSVIDVEKITDRGGVTDAEQLLADAEVDDWRVA